MLVSSIISSVNLCRFIATISDGYNVNFARKDYKGSTK